MSYPETSPAAVVQSYLVAQAVFTAPSAGSSWPMYVSHLPDGDNVEVNAAAIFDDAPVLDGRIMHDGEVIQHYGLLVRLRAQDYETGWVKALSVLSALASVARTSVIVSGKTFTLYALTTKSGIMPLGVEPGTKRRYLFDNNYTVSMIQEN